MLLRESTIDIPTAVPSFGVDQNEPIPTVERRVIIDFDQVCAMGDNGDGRTAITFVGGNGMIVNDDYDELVKWLLKQADDE